MSAQDRHSNPTVLSALVNARDPEALAHVASTLERHGTLAAAADELGITTRTLSRWRADHPEIAAVRTSKSQRLTAEQEAEARRELRAAKGVGLLELRDALAARYGCSARTISRVWAAAPKAAQRKAKH